MDPSLDRLTQCQSSSSSGERRDVSAFAAYRDSDQVKKRGKRVNEQGLPNIKPGTFGGGKLRRMKRRFKKYSPYLKDKLADKFGKLQITTVNHDQTGKSLRIANGAHNKKDAVLKSIHRCNDNSMINDICDQLKRTKFPRKESNVQNGISLHSDVDQ